MTQILDPTDERVPVRRSLAPRPQVLRDDRPARYQQGARRRDDRAAQAAPERTRLPGVADPQGYRKPTPAKPAPDDIRHKMLEECDFVVEALAD